MKFFIALVAVLAAPALAQSGDDAEESYDFPDVHPLPKPSREIIVTAIGARLDVEKTGQPVTVFERRDIDRLQAVAVADLLRTGPGVGGASNGGPGSFSAIRIRGAEDTQTLVLYDGVRLNDPSSPGGGFDFGNLLTGNIERIEVLRGPNSVPWGSQAIGGVVNITTGRRNAVRAEYGSRDAASLVGQAEGQVGPVLFGIGGGLFGDDGISAFKDGNERDGFRHIAGNATLIANPSSNTELELRAYYARGRTEIDGFPPPAFSFAETPQLSRSRQLTLHAGATHWTRNGDFINRLAFTFSDVNRDNYDGPGQRIPSFLARGRTERFEYHGDAELSRNIRAVFGLEHERSRFNDGATAARTRVSGGFVQAIVEPVDTLTITGGARVDDHKDYGTQTTFSANLAWRPVDGTILRLAYGEGFKAPTLFQLFSFFGNPALDPERARSYEAGIEQHLLDDRLRLGLTVFQRDTRNQIDFISCFGQTTGICANRPFGTYDNIVRTRARGIEVFILAKPSDLLTLNANYSLIDAENRASGLALLRRPKHSVNASIDWNAFGKAELGADVRLTSDSADVDFRTFARTRLDGYALVTLRAAVPLNDTVEVYGRVENLFDERYETVSGYGAYGRNAHVGVRAKF